MLTRPLPPADFDRWRDHWRPETGPARPRHQRIMAFAETVPSQS